MSYKITDVILLEVTLVLNLLKEILLLLTMRNQVFFVVMREISVCENRFRTYGQRKTYASSIFLSPLSAVTLSFNPFLSHHYSLSLLLYPCDQLSTISGYCSFLFIYFLLA